MAGQRLFAKGILLVSFAIITAIGCTSTSSKKQFLLIAHRGGVVDGNISENSLSGLEEAIKRGYTHVEIDVRVTKDGHTVCFHDNNLMREAGVDKNIPELSLAEVKKIQLVRSKETIPTFEEFCSQCKGRINLMVDTKGVEDRYVERYCMQVEAALAKHGLLKNALFIMDRTPKNNQDKVADWFLGKAKVSLRVSLEEAKKRENSLPEELSHYYFVFNSPKYFTQEDIKGFHKMGLWIIPSINMSHYKTGDPLKQGLADVQKMLDWGVDGLQIDSCYDPLVFKSIK